MLDKAEPKFSIVIPTLNRVQLLERSLSSALGQEGVDDYEVVVLDNCSEDGTWDYLCSVNDPKLKVLRNPHRLPVGPNWNKAVRSSEGEFIHVLADDDLLMPNMLAAVSNSISKYEGVGLIGFGIYLMDEDGNNRRSHWQPEREELLPAPEALIRFARRWILGAPYTLFSRDTFERYGEWNETQSGMSDAEAILRWMVDVTTLLVPEVLAAYCIWAGQETNNVTHTSGAIDTMVHLVNNVLRLATESGRLDEAQLEELYLSLVQTFLIDFFRGPHQ